MVSRMPGGQRFLLPQNEESLLIISVLIGGLRGSCTMTNG